MTLRPTYRHPRAAAYRAPGGPWDVPALPALLGGAPELARGLRSLGIRRGDIVAWQAPNWPEVVELYRACWQLGAVAAPIHHQAGPADVDQLLRQLDPACFLARDELRDRVRSLASGSAYHAVHARPADVAAVLWTGGSEGEPKGVLHTHRSLAHKAVTMVRAHGLTSGDAVLMPAPLAHISGLLNGVLVPGAAGMSSVLMERWDADQAIALIEANAISFMIGPPTFFVGMMAASTFDHTRVRSLRLISSGGAGVTSDFVVEAQTRFGAHVKRSYGSTEAPTITTSTAADPPDRASHSDGRVVGSAVLRIAADGELLVQGPELFAGYLDPDQTRNAVTRGWFHTGDLATLDDGWLTITGRKTDTIIRAGENIAAAEVERIVAAHPAVREVAAVGEFDPRLGERVCVFVVGDASFDLDECRRWFETQGVARFKTPERVEHLDTMPTLPAGKINRTELRARLTQPEA